jgi:hypothetical protein
MKIYATRRVLLGITMLLTASTAALAAPTTLICTNNQRPSDPAFTIDLDEAKGTVTIASTIMTATFDAREIKWVLNNVSEKIDRVTGLYTADLGQGVVLSFPCRAGKAQF